MSIIKIAATCFVCAALISLLRERGGRFYTFVSALVGIFLIGEAVNRISPLLEYTALVSEYIPAACLDVSIKSMGVGIAASVGASGCRELGAGEIGERLLFLARCEIVVICLPLLVSAMESTLGSLA